jgi:hypothetical protein
MNKLHLLLLFVALSAVAFVGCDSNDDDDDDYSAVLGRWEALDTEDQDDTYLNISDDEIVAHYFVAEEDGGTDCFERETLNVVSRDGNEWTLRDTDTTATVIIRRDGDDLETVISESGFSFTTRFDRSTRTDFTPLCDE